MGYKGLPPSENCLDLYKGKTIVLHPTSSIRNGKTSLYIEEVVSNLQRKGVDAMVAHDSIALDRIRDENRDRINEILLLTCKNDDNSDREKHLPSLLLEGEFDPDGNCASRPNLLPKYKEALRVAHPLLPEIGKVAIVAANQVMDELQKWRGVGTLCINPDLMQCSRASYDEKQIFRHIYNEHESTGKFKERKPSELDEIEANQYMLRVKNSLLGGFSLIQRDKKWMELCALWAGYMGSGVGEYLYSEAKKIFDSSDAQTLFALSTNAKTQESLVRWGMKRTGPVETTKFVRPDLIPDYIRTYDTSERNPVLFVQRKTT